MSTGRPAVAIHGHFYQPPREDPWFDAVPRQPGAAPFHDWNQRIERECYGPTVAASILDGEGTVRRVLNCLEYMSFNFGPTLLSWLEEEAPETYEAVLEADRKSIARTGHGGAIAMPFHHPILPLSDKRDKVTEVRWGIEDFRARFGRDPDGMWLPETAADPETLEVLAGEGIRFTILAPHQVDPLPSAGRPGVYTTPSGASITLFPYDGAGSHAVAFGSALRDAEKWTSELSASPEGKGPGALRLIATDGETYGHHKKFGEMALAATLERLAESQDVNLVNLSQYVASTPDMEPVDLVAPSSWSCAHGFERWRADCGCKLDPDTESQQRWRGPLRTALTWLAGRLHRAFEEGAADLFKAPWEVRDAYGAVAGNPDPARLRAWVRARLEGDPDPAILNRAVRLLELERNALRLFTSCAWFFDDLAGVESVQVLRYAARAIDLARSELGAEGADALEKGFLRLLEKATSNDPQAGDARRVYLERAQPAIAPPVLVVAGYAAVARLLGPGSAPRYRTYVVDAQPDAIQARHVATGETHSYVVSVDGGREPRDLTVTVTDRLGTSVSLAFDQLPEAARTKLGEASVPIPGGPPVLEAGLAPRAGGTP